MDKIFHIESNEEFQKELKELADFYCSRNFSNEFNRTISREANYELMRLILGSNFEANVLTNTLLAKGYNEERTSYFLNVLNEKKSELLYATLIHQNCENYGETVTGFDWVLKLVLGTSELNTLRSSILQLILMSTDSNASQRKVVYDLNKDMLLKAIHVLEKIKDS